MDVVCEPPRVKTEIWPHLLASSHSVPEALLFIHLNPSRISLPLTVASSLRSAVCFSLGSSSLFLSLVLHQPLALGSRAHLLFLLAFSSIKQGNLEGVCLSQIWEGAVLPRLKVACGGPFSLTTQIPRDRLSCSVSARCMWNN